MLLTSYFLKSILSLLTSHLSPLTSHLSPPKPLRPKRFFARKYHFSLTFRTSLFVPYPDVVASAIQAKSSHFTSIRRRNISNDATDNDILDGVAIRTTHGSDALAKQSLSFIVLRLVSARFTTICFLPSHFKSHLSIEIDIQANHHDDQGCPKTNNGFGMAFVNRRGNVVAFSMFIHQ